MKEGRKKGGQEGGRVKVREREGKTNPFIIESTEQHCKGGCVCVCERERGGGGEIELLKEVILYYFSTTS